MLIDKHGRLLVDSGKNPENFVHEIKWVNENDNGGNGREEIFRRRSDAMAALHRISEMAGVTFVSYARRNA